LLTLKNKSIKFKSELFNKVLKVFEKAEHCSVLKKILPSIKISASIKKKLEKNSFKKFKKIIFFGGFLKKIKYLLFKNNCIKVFIFFKNPPKKFFFFKKIIFFKKEELVV